MNDVSPELALVDDALAAREREPTARARRLPRVAAGRPCGTRPVSAGADAPRTARAAAGSRDRAGGAGAAREGERAARRRAQTAPDARTRRVSGGPGGLRRAGAPGGARCAGRSRSGGHGSRRRGARSGAGSAAARGRRAGGRRARARVARGASSRRPGPDARVGRVGRPAEGPPRAPQGSRTWHEGSGRSARAPYADALPWS